MWKNGWKKIFQHFFLRRFNPLTSLQFVHFMVLRSSLQIFLKTNQICSAVWLREKQRQEVKDRKGAGSFGSPETALTVRETTQKKSDSARVTHSTIISVIILMYSWVRTSLLEPMMGHGPSCRTQGGGRSFINHRAAHWTKHQLKDKTISKILHVLK